MSTKIENLRFQSLSSLSFNFFFFNAHMMFVSMSFVNMQFLCFVRVFLFNAHMMLRFFFLFFLFGYGINLFILINFYLDFSTYLYALSTSLQILFILVFSYIDRLCLLLEWFIKEKKIALLFIYLIFFWLLVLTSSSFGAINFNSMVYLKQLFASIKFWSQCLP